MTKVQSKNAILYDVANDNGDIRTALVGTIGEAGAASGLMSVADKAKIDGVAAGATANDTDAELRERATHTGSQAISTVIGLADALAAKATAAQGALADTAVQPGDVNLLLPERFGAVGDGTTDDTAALVSMFSASTAGAVIHLVRGKTYITDSLTIPSGVTFSGGGVIKGKTSGTRPTRSDITGAADAAARSALLEAYYQTVITFSGSSFVGALSFIDVLLSGPGSLEVCQSSYLELISSAADNFALWARKTSVVAAPGLIAINSPDHALQAWEGATVDAPGAIIAHCYRGARVVRGGAINLENAEIWNSANAGVYIQIEGAVSVKNAVIDGCTLAGITNNYGGHFNAEGLVVRNCTSGVGVMIESNGSCYLENGQVTDCQNALGVALGGFIQARGVTITGTSFVVANALNDGFISMENATVDGISNPGSGGIRFQATGTGRILISEPGVGVLTNLSTESCSPVWNSIGRGAAYIGSMGGNPAAAHFSSLKLDTDLPISQGGTGASSQLAFLSSFGLIKQVLIANNEVYTITLPNTVSQGMVAICSNSPTAGAGLFRWRAAASPFMRQIAADGIVSLTTGALTEGTGDGVDGNVNLSAEDAGKIHIKNRTGSPLNMLLVLLQGAQNYAFP